ncbi:MAG: GAF domain-containing protein [Candidatus Delongbacteria bacterium]|nr:GAF domain-containing protein [Candidatus Delongbacteria bacterium]
MESVKPEIKSGRYQRVHRQLSGLLSSPADPVAQMATMVAVLYHKFPYFFWCGFYCRRGTELWVGPYQGNLACMKLPENTGVCWAGINQERTLVVPDVHDFPGHIACDSRSRSEIVVPFRDQQAQIAGVLDVDGRSPGLFDEQDARGLELILSLLVL